MLIWCKNYSLTDCSVSTPARFRAVCAVLQNAARLRVFFIRLRGFSVESIFLVFCLPCDALNHSLCFNVENRYDSYDNKSFLSTANSIGRLSLLHVY